ncbi:MAG: M15 family metallopeptidase, partial [Prevotella sp.]|nr:M15 family metallopeptidase [Prevotella sp.]
ELYRHKYPIERMRLIDDYDADDERSMQANNTSCFNFRAIAGSTKLSKHSQGLAIDINPLYNPCVKQRNDGRTVVQPATGRKYANRSKRWPYMIVKDDLCYRLFTEHGFKWGGSWRTLKDYQHFER